MTEYARLKTKIKDIVTGKYKSPAQGRTNFAYEKRAVEQNTDFNNQNLVGPPTLQQTQDKLKNSLNNFTPSTDPVVNKIKAMEIMANTAKNPILQSNATASQTTDNSAQYEEKYKHTPKTYEGYMKHAPYVAEEEKAWLKKQAEAVATADDYRKEAEKSKADLVHLDSLYNDAMRNFTQEDDAIDKKITKKEKEFASFQEKAEQKEYESKTKDILKNDVKVRTIIEQYYRLQNESIETDTYTQMMNGGKTDSVYTSDEEKRIIQNFNNLAQKGYNPEELYNYYKRQKEAEASSYAIESLKKEAKERPVAMSAWSTIDNAVGSIGDAGKYIGAGVTEFVTGEKQYIDTNDTAAARTQAIRGAVSEKIGENIDNDTASGVAQFLYQTGMSMADFLVTLPLNFIPGIGQGLQLAVLSTSAGTSAAKEAYDNTGKASNALSTGFVAGIAETVLEKISIDELFKIFNSKDATTVVNVLKNAAKQSGVEAIEEGSTNIINTMADGLINGDKSAFSIEYQEYISQGLSEDEAMQKCIASLAKQLALDAAGGALSGGVIGGGASTINYAGIKIDTKRDSQELGKEILASEDFDMNLLLSEAKASSNKKAVSIANAIEKQMKKNVNYKVEAVDVGNLVKLVATSPKAETSTETETRTETETNQPETQKVETNAQQYTEEVKSYGFGEQHPNGVNAVDSKGNQLVIRRIESSARVYGEADNRVKVMTTDGKIIDADELTFNLPQYNELASAAKNFDTNGARALVAYYESYVDYKEHKTNMQEYLEGFTKLYEAGRMGGTWENVKNHRSYAGYINSIGLTAAINAVHSGGNDSNTALQNEANKLVRVETREGRVYVEPNAEEDLQVDETTMQVLELLSKKTGREIILTNELGDHENGRFQDGKVYISTNLNQNYVLPVAIHECVHGIRKDSPADYAVIKGFIIDYLFENGHNVEHMVDDIKAKWGNKVASYEDCIEEIVCNAMMSIATDENSMQKALKVAHANENILDKIAQAFNNLVAKIKDYLIKFRDNKAAKIFVKDVETLEQIAEMFNKAAENAKAATGESNGSKSLMAGEKAKIVNYSNLATAKEMENNGADSETIRQNTGWFKGYDDKWRFEIDDSEMEIATNGRFSRDPDISRYTELIDKVYFKNDYTSEEESELRELDKKLEGKSVEPEFLGDLIKHDKLFEAYPQLKEISVYFAKNTKGEMGAYHPGLKEIALEHNLKIRPEELRSTLIHEIQHAVQDIEGFAEGSSITYWKSQSQDILDTLTTARANLDLWLKDIGYNDFVKKSMQEVVKKNKTLDQHWIDCQDFKENSEYANQIAKCEAEIAEYEKQYKEITKGMTPSEQYLNTAGEIEARDASKRMNFTAEQRKNTRPDIDRTDVVFVEEGDVKYSVDDSITSKDIEILRTINIKSVNDFTAEERQKTEKWARRFYKELKTKSPFFRAWFGDWRAYDTSMAVATSINAKSNINIENRTIKNNDTKWAIQVNKSVFDDSLHYAGKEKMYLERLLTDIDTVLQRAILFDTAVSKKSSGNKKGSTQFMHYLYSLVEYNGSPFLAKIAIEEYGNENNRRAYNVQRIKMSALSRAQYSQMKSAYREKFASNADVVSVADLHALVKQYDGKFNPKFVNEKFLNEDGTPKVFYHGTNAKWTKYDFSKNVNQMWGEGIYLTPYKERARLYGDNVMPFYVKADNDYRTAKLNGKTRDYTLMKKTGDVLVYSPNQIKSVTDNVGTFDSNNSDIRYSMDDTFNDWLDDAVPQGIDFDKVLEINPTVALATVYRSAAKTTESGLAQSKGVDLDDRAFLSIARKVMQRYEIKHKNNPEYAQELAEKLKKFTKTVENGEYESFAEFFEEFVEECRGGILLSDNYDKFLFKEERESILSVLVGKKLIIRNRDVSSVEDKYGSISNYRKLFLGRLNIGVEKNSNSDSFYIEDILDYVKDNYPYLITTENYNDNGYIWLEKLINDVLMPKYENKRLSSYEAPDTTAIELAFYCTAEIIDAKANQLVLNEKADKKQIRALAKARSDAKKYTYDITKAKRKQYQRLFEAANKLEYNTEHKKRMKQLEISGKVIENDRGIKKRLRERAKTLLDENKKQKAIISSGMRSIREEYNEGREKTKYIHSLGRMLDRLSKRLDGKAKNGEYIPDALKKPILEVLGSFTAQPVSLADGKKITTPGYFGEWKHLAEIGERVQDLQKAYMTLKKPPKKTDQQYSFVDVESLSYKEEVMEDLSHLSSLLKGHNIYTLSASELREIYETMSFLERSLKEAVEIIVDGQKVNIAKLAEEAISDVNDVYFNKDVDSFGDVIKNILASVPREIRNSFVATHLDPVRYSKFLSGYKENSIVYKLFSDLHSGDVKRIKIMQNSFAPVQKVLNRYTEQMRGLQRDDVTKFNFYDLDTGKRVKISQATLIAIYLTDKQTAGRRHLLGKNPKGIVKPTHCTVVPDLDYANAKKSAIIENLMSNGKVKEKQHRVRFNEENLQGIAKYVEGNRMLLQLANAISSVYNEYLNQQINEVSMAKYGMKIATVKDYYPLRVYQDGATFEKNFEAEFHDERLKNRGFTKQRETSSSPIMINDVLETFSIQVQVVSEYCGLLIPIENFKKVYNVGIEGMTSTHTLHEAILDKFGHHAEHYIDKLMGDLQKPADNIDNTFIDRMQSKFMGAKIIANPGAMLKQFAAYPLANRYFGSANVAKAFASGTRKVDLEKYSEYTPYLWYRKDGNGTVVGEVSREHGLARKGLDWFDFVGKMDNRVVGSLLYAAELHVEQTTNLKKGSNDFYREVVRQFEKCIDETQPNNMVTSKPQYLRNKSLKLLSLSAFRSQNMAIGNTMLDSFMEFSARQHEYKFKSNEETKAARDAAAKKFASCCIAACESSIMIGILTVAINMLLWHKRDKYKDEEGNISPEKIFWNFISETFNSLSGTFAFGDYLYQAIEAAITGDNFYGLQVMGVENISNAISNAIDGDWWSVIMLLGDCFGLPADNLYRMSKSIYLYGKNAIYGPVFNDKGKLNTTHLNFYILEAKKNGDTGKAEVYEKMWKEVLVNEQGKTEGEAVEYIKDKLVTALATDDNVEDAAVAKANGELDAYEGYRQKAVDYGFDSKDVQKAIDKSLKNIITEIKENGLEDEAEIKAQLIEEGFNEQGAEYVLRQMTKSKKESTLTSSFEETSEEDELVMYDYSDAFEALVSGDSDSYEKIESYLIEQGGKKKSEIKSAMRSASRTDKLWEEYIEASTITNDSARTKELVDQLTRIYGAWSQATVALRKYRKRIAEQEE